MFILDEVTEELLLRKTDISPDDVLKLNRITESRLFVTLIAEYLLKMKIMLHEPSLLYLLYKYYVFSIVLIQIICVRQMQISMESISSGLKFEILKLG